MEVDARSARPLRGPARRAVGPRRLEPAVRRSRRARGRSRPRSSTGSRASRSSTEGRPRRSSRDATHVLRPGGALVLETHGARRGRRRRPARRARATRDVSRHPRPRRTRSRRRGAPTTTRASTTRSPRSRGQLVVIPTDTVYGLAADGDERGIAARRSTRRRAGTRSSRRRVLFASRRPARSSACPSSPSASRPRAAARARYTLVAPEPGGPVPWLSAERPDAIGVRVPPSTARAARCSTRSGCWSRRARTFRAAPTPAASTTCRREIVARSPRSSTAASCRARRRRWSTSPAPSRACCARARSPRDVALARRPPSIYGSLTPADARLTGRRETRRMRRRRSPSPRVASARPRQPRRRPPRWRPSAVTGRGDVGRRDGRNVTGKVDPGGEATSWYVEYGTTTRLRLADATPRSAGNGTRAVDVSSSCAGSTTGATYHYRLVATNAAGTSRGADETFTTRAPPTVVTGAGLGARAHPGRRSAARSIPNGRSTGWWVEYGTSDELRVADRHQVRGLGHGAVAVSVRLTGLRAGVAPTTSGSSRRTTSARPAAPTRRSSPTARRPSSTGGVDAISVSSARVDRLGRSATGRGTVAGSSTARRRRSGAGRPTSTPASGHGRRGRDAQLTGLQPGHALPLPCRRHGATPGRRRGRRAPSRRAPARSS